LNIQSKHPDLIDPDDELPGALVLGHSLAKLNSPVPATLYHYTSGAGLLGIVDTKVIWATDVRFLNDRREYVHGRDLCVSMLRQVKLDSKWGASCHAAADTIEQTTTTSFYSTCFCEEDDLVPQWRGYAARGAGYALGFETGPLAPLDDGMLLKVRYEEKDQRKAVADLIESLLHTRDASVKKFPKDVDRIGQEAALLLSMGLTILALSFKPRVFAYEREWRLVYFRIAGMKNVKPVLFRDTAGLVVPYVQLPLTESADKPVALTSVRCGPTLFDVEAPASIVEYLATRGIKCPVLRSEAPLRSFGMTL